MDGGGLAKLLEDALTQGREEGRQEGWKAGMEDAAGIVDDHDPQLADWIREKLTDGKD